MRQLRSQTANKNKQVHIQAGSIHSTHFTEESYDKQSGRTDLNG